jgi:hypothetical protein
MLCLYFRYTLFPLLEHITSPMRMKVMYVTPLIRTYTYPVVERFRKRFMFRSPCRCLSCRKWRARVPVQRVPPPQNLRIAHIPISCMDSCWKYTIIPGIRSIGIFGLADRDAGRTVSPWKEMSITNRLGKL